jgi:hypothetical protein
MSLMTPVASKWAGALCLRVACRWRRDARTKDCLRDIREPRSVGREEVRASRKTARLTTSSGRHYRDVPDRPPHPWHSRARGGAVHSITTRLMHCSTRDWIAIPVPICILLVGRINFGSPQPPGADPRPIWAYLGSGPWMVAAFCFLRTQAGLLALRDRPITLRQTEEVARR